MARRKQTTARPAKTPIKTESTRKNVSASNTSSKKADMRSELRKRGEAGGLVSLICEGDIRQQIKLPFLGCGYRNTGSAAPPKNGVCPGLCLVGLHWSAASRLREIERSARSRPWGGPHSFAVCCSI